MILVGAGYVIAQLARPAPAMRMTALAVPVRVLPGASLHPAWPAQAETAVGVAGMGMLATHGGSQPRPIASLAKIMTAYVVLRDHPLAAGGQGLTITVRQADVAAYAADKRQGQSVVKVVAGEKLSELQALEAMLIPSGNNIADLLAAWDAGSRAAFVSRMNSTAKSLVLHDTHYADASGFDPGTVSTAADQFRLTLRALQNQQFRNVVAMPQISLPAAGVAYNVNYALGHDGIDGVKTGSSNQAGACLDFSASRVAAGYRVTIVGVVLGVQPTAAQPSELTAVTTSSERLLNSLSAALERVQVVQPGTVLGRVRTAWAPGPAAVAASGVTVLGWPGMPVRVTVVPRTLPSGIAKGQPVGSATVTVGGDVAHVMLRAQHAVAPPSALWRLGRL